MIFQLTEKRTRWFGGYNSHLHSLSADIQDEFEGILGRSKFLNDAPFKTLALFLQFSDVEGGPKVHYQERHESRLHFEAAVDWKDQATADREKLRSFFSESIARCLMWLAKEYKIRHESLEHEMNRFGISPSAPLNGLDLKDAICDIPENELKLCIKMSDDRFGTEEERDRCHRLAEQITPGEKEYDTEAGGGFYRMYFSSDEPRNFFKQIQPILKKSRLRRGSYAEAQYLAGFFLERDRFELS
jgi:hypothetical protein